MSHPPYADSQALGLSPLKKVSFTQNLSLKISQWCQHPKAIWVMVLVSFAESSFFPLPPDMMLIAMILANRRKTWLLAGLCSVASILGGVLGYGIGAYLSATLGQWIMETYQLHDKFLALQSHFQEWGFWYIMVKGLTPIPYKLLTLTSGMTQLSFVQFLTASVIVRTGRFFILSGLVWWFGVYAQALLERFLFWILLGMLGMLIVGFLMVRFVL
jgi:membrane protein YqaA with SNARE-associated domain